MTRKAGRGKVRALALWLLLIGAAACGLGGWSVWRLAHKPMLDGGAPVRVVVEPGMKFRAVAARLDTAGVFHHPRLLGLMAHWRRQAERIQAGVYEVRAGMTPLDLLDRMAAGESLQDSITFVEGWTFAQFRQALDAHASVRHDTAGQPDRAILERIGAIETHPEGLFFPDSYRFGVGTSDLAILRQARGRMRAMLEQAWGVRAPDVPLESPYALLILASVVEKETGRAQDRPQVAAVFANRLRRGMRLQSDPTVIYGLGAAFDGNLRRVDLETDTPYNTYTRAGLPPTPIAAPGLAALKAAAAPPESEALYFVARGDGTSEFSATLEAHNRAVARYQRP